MDDLVQLRADVSRELKRRAFVALATRELKFSAWLRQQLRELAQLPEDPDTEEVSRDDSE